MGVRERERQSFFLHFIYLFLAGLGLRCRVIFSPAGARCGALAGARCSAPAGARCGAPAGARCGAPAGARCGAPAGARCGAPAGARCGARASHHCGFPCCGARPTASLRECAWPRRVQPVSSVLAASGVWSTGSVVVARELGCSVAHETFPDQEWNLRLLYWQMESFTTESPGKPRDRHLLVKSQKSMLNTLARGA